MPCLPGLWVGIGCKRGTSKIIIEQAIRSVFQAHDLAESAIAGMATIDTKANETGLVEFCRDRHLPLRCFAAEALRSVCVPHPSGAIAAAIGTPSVAEAAALLASGWRGGGENNLHLPLTPDTRHPTPALCVAKQIFRPLGQAGSVTVAVARSLTHRSLA